MSGPQQEQGPDIAAERQRVALAWLDITIQNFRANIKKLKIGSTGELYESFRGALVGAAGGDELKLRLVYALQGMYVDMGVGRGMGAGVTKDQGADYRRLRNGKGKLHRHQRKAKRWQSRQLAREQHRLGELMSDISGRTLIATVSMGLPKSIEVNL
ncbi:hypothetical protein [Hymenobacter psychrotolerans]|uniref:Uncharacterized protein n=1 Tax=Hymenobacter psychrotolerans DSM 18569 TaxID=1121959 RepID=A0A1M6Z5W2_9BACT|nr:hypothetical protein [Hymenobacter psychrotolerans]SHL25830.1 hypothetical protein SAMN02746009_02432 [Hymenobacter psychrotolerans DSM 18569]